MKYLKTFPLHDDYNEYISGQAGDVYLPNVSYCEDDEGVHYNRSQQA